MATRKRAKVEEGEVGVWVDLTLELTDQLVGVDLLAMVGALAFSFAVPKRSANDLETEVSALGGMPGEPE